MGCFLYQPEVCLRNNNKMIKKSVAHIKTDDLEILFRMVSKSFDETIIGTIESAGCKYLIKGNEYPIRASQVTPPSNSFIKDEEGRETAELFTKPDTWDKGRGFVVSRVLKPEKVVIAYEKRGNADNYIKEAKYDMVVGPLLLQSFCANELIF